MPFHTQGLPKCQTFYLNLQNGPLGAARFWIGFPHADAAEITVAIVAGLESFGQAAEFVDEAAADYDVIGDEGKFQLLEAKEDLTRPLLFPKAIEADLTQHVFDNPAFIRQVTELEGQDISFPNESGAESSAEPEKKHTAAAITAERLHGGVVNHAGRFA